MAEDADRSTGEAAGPRIARLLIERRSFEVSVSVPSWSRPEDPNHFPILVDVNNETRALEGRRVRYLTLADVATRPDFPRGVEVPSQINALTDLGAAVVLTAREHEVLAELAKGASNKSIARALGISTGTVRVHVKSVLRKLALDNRTQAAVWAAAAATREDS
ncbi:MAG: helix-turn-helix domain-containing protein [Sphingomonas sp.]